MKQWKSKAVLSPAPDPESLLHYIDRAVVTTEYGRASAFLASVPSEPPINLTLLKQMESEVLRRSSFSKGLSVEQFVQSLSKEGRYQVASVQNGGKRNEKPADRQDNERSSNSRSEFPPNSSSQSTSTKTKPPQTSFSDSLSLLSNPSQSQEDKSREDEYSQTSHTGFQHNSILKFRHLNVPSPTKFSHLKPSPVVVNRIHRASVYGGDVEVRKSISAPDLEVDSFQSEDLDSESMNLNDSETQDRRYDEATADQAYRAGSAAMEEGQMAKAISLLRLASFQCPPDRTSALIKIEKLIAAAAQELEMQEATRNTVQPVTSEDIELRVADGLESPMPMKILAVGDMVKADEAYRAGVAALEAGDPAKALEHLRRATLACPQDRPSAAYKIQTLIEQANFELRVG